MQISQEKELFHTSVFLRRRKVLGLMRVAISLILVFGRLFPASAQSTYINLNEDLYHQIERYETKSGVLSPYFFSSVKPYKRDAVVSFFNHADSTGLLTSNSDKFNRSYFLTDSREFASAETGLSKRTVFKKLYNYKSDFSQVREKDFDLHVNPVLYAGYGKDNLQQEPLYINTRGFELRSTVDGKVGIYTFVTENQMRLPFYVQQQVNEYRVLPHELLWKRFKTNGADFLQARAYISFRATKHIDVQFGQDRTFIGNGYRSMILSDWSPPALFLRTNLKVWKINYMYQLSRLNADVLTSPAGTLIRGRYPQKFFAFHQASINLGKKVNVSVFESVIFSPKDPTTTDYFDLGYLNPVIFYRSVEQQFGSPDNVILGTDFRWLMAKNLSVYGQFTLDEFVLSNMLAGNGWWGNKFGIQGGVKATDVFGISNLDLQLEGNVARPYTYSQSSKYLSYSHYRQPLAHPLGANFTEVIGILRYQPFPGLQITGKAIAYNTGKDGADENWGGDILKENDVNRAGNTGNKIGQGRNTSVIFGELHVSHMIRHNLFIDLRQTFRRSQSEIADLDNSSNLSTIAVRLNIAPRTYEY
ncbi:MAG: hypothetical protein ACO3FI_06100 [Cyclobacteriaceae bacterium]